MDPLPTSTWISKTNSNFSLSLAWIPSFDCEFDYSHENCMFFSEYFQNNGELFERLAQYLYLQRSLRVAEYVPKTRRFIAITCDDGKSTTQTSRYLIGNQFIIVFRCLSTNFLFLLAETVDENIDATNAKCKTIKLPMTVSKMDGFSYYNFSVWPLKRKILDYFWNSSLTVV